MFRQPPPLPSDAFARLDELPDALFYRYPRLVTHIDAGAIAAVTQLYREWFPRDGRVLDLMSSWVSHLPQEIAYREVVGVGMNAQELEANPRLTSSLVQDLNRDPILPFDSDTFDAAGICVSIDYLTDPVAVLREVSRVLRADAPLVITYSNRCFPTKAVAIWRQLSDQARGELICAFIEQSAGFTAPRWIDCGARERDPLYAVVAHKHAGG